MKHKKSQTLANGLSGTDNPVTIRRIVTLRTRQWRVRSACALTTSKHATSNSNLAATPPNHAQGCPTCPERSRRALRRQGWVFRSRTSQKQLHHRTEIRSAGGATECSPARRSRSDRSAGKHPNKNRQVPEGRLKCPTRSSAQQAANARKLSGTPRRLILPLSH
jgi:hypothetical protein